ncbi:MAG: cation:proton antiporter subunit C [Turicibacter sp.]|nr:cation:proton antiporter subunit C [Turicibacter sp.]
MGITDIMGIETIEILIIAMFFIGFYGVITTTNIVKSIVFIIILETAVIMFFLSIGYHVGILPPIGGEPDIYNMADPLPQALMITAVVIGLTGTAVNIIVFITLFRKHGTANWEVAARKNKEEFADE